MRWPPLLALLGLAAGAPLYAGPSAAHAVIERCAHEADGSLQGLDALRRNCPQIEDAVHELGIDPLLPAGWQKTASARALADLAALSDRYAAAWPALRLDGARLKSIAHGLAPPPVPPSLWERIEAWLRHWLEPNTRSAPGWLRFLPHWQISPRAARMIFGALAVLIVFGVGALVARELKASGLIRAGGRGRVPRHAPAGMSPVHAPSLDLEALDAAHPRDRPVLLLRLLVRALTRSQRLARDRNLTCRELIAKARFDSPRQREQFERFALLAERALYGGDGLASAGVPEEMLPSARALHAELLAAPRLGPGGP